jgi:type IV pilus assembly protein PilQ
MRFGSTAPVSSNTMNSATGRLSNPPIITNPLSDANVFLDTSNPTIVEGINGGITSVFFPSVAGVSGNPTQTGLTTFTPAQSVTDNGVTTITAATAEYGLPAYFQYPKKFQAQVEAQIRSGNAKILTDPTLVVQEGQEANVKLTQSVVTSVNSQVDPLSGVRTTTPVLSDVGLTMKVNLDRVDDNGFISLSIVPTIAAPGATQQFESGPGSTNTITLINKREVQSGLVRLRDGQTLILTGVIQETDQSTTSKVPILGDIPILGALFRSQSDTTARTEVVIMVTPQILNDGTEAQFGFNYTPSKASSDLLRQQGFPVQAQP